MLLGYLRLNTQRLQSHNLPPLPINRNNIILRARALQLDPEDLDLPVPSLLDSIDDRLVLAFEALGSVLLDLLVAADEFL